jgi:hypothetical protein
MKRVKTTEHLAVFDAGPFREIDGANHECMRRRLYFAVERDMSDIDDSRRWTAITALFTIDSVAAERRRKERGEDDWYMLEWLETSRYYDKDPERAQALRDEFMGALRELHPGMTAEPEGQESNGVANLDTLAADELPPPPPSEVSA